MDSSLEDNVLTIKTIQISPWKTLITALKDIIVETNIYFTPSGIRIIDMDASHTIAVNAFLPSGNFELFECKKEKIIIGVSILNFFKCLSVLESNETLTMYIRNEDYIDGVVNIFMMKFENEEKGSQIIRGMHLVDPNLEELSYPDLQYSSIINMPSSEFQRNIKTLMMITDRVEIKSVGNEIIFSGKGNIGTSETRYRERKDNLIFKKKQPSSKIIQGEFSLKNLIYFVKCTSLCPNIQLLLENDRPLIVKYAVSSLGDIELCLAPFPAST